MQSIHDLEVAFKINISFCEKKIEINTISYLIPHNARDHFTLSNFDMLELRFGRF